MSKSVKIVSIIIVVVLVVACLLFLLHYTDGFKKDFATFYVSEGKQDILHGSYGNVFKRAYHFKVHYTFGVFQQDKSWHYKLRCINDFVFEIDGEQHQFSELDLDNLFDIKTTEDGLTVDFSKDFYTIVSELYNVDKEVIHIPTDVVRSDVVELTFYSADGKHSVKVSGIFGGLEQIFNAPSDQVEVMF
ncbi:MAG: hypothetical protein IJX23_05100 [Clostridia bacterium]|nr:hypothetical protein [Clostridia bacterium]